MKDKFCIYYIHIIYEKASCVYNFTDTSAYSVIEGGTSKIVDLSNVNWSQLNKSCF